MSRHNRNNRRNHRGSVRRFNARKLVQGIREEIRGEVGADIRKWDSALKAANSVVQRQSVTIASQRKALQEQNKLIFSQHALLVKFPEMFRIEESNTKVWRRAFYALCVIYPIMQIAFYTLFKLYLYK